MRAAGWTRVRWLANDGNVYERVVPAPFGLTAEFWVDDAPVLVAAQVTLQCDAVDQALEELGEGDIAAWIVEDPLSEDIAVERPERVEEVAGDVVARIGAAAERLRACATVDAFNEAVATREDTRESAAIAVPVVLAVSGRVAEARERARAVPGDFAERLDRWLAGERIDTPEPFDWVGAFKTSLRKARERDPHEGGRRRPGASWPGPRAI